MTVWKALQSEQCYAVAIYNFAGEGPHRLPLQVGDLLVLECECEHWYRGRLLRAERDVRGAGVFPKTYVRLRDKRAIDGELDADIADTLRDWLKHWKTLYVTNGEQFSFMEVSMRTLLELRSGIVGGALTKQQLQRCLRTAAFTVDRGRRALGQQLAVRGPDLRPVGPHSMPLAALVRLHQETEDRLARNMEHEKEAAPDTAARLLQATVRNFVCRVPEDVELRLCLCNSTEQLTECFILPWPAHISPETAPAARTVLYQDLSEAEMRAEKTHLVCYVIRIGAMDPPNLDAKRSSLLAGGAAPAANGQRIRRPFAVACLDITKILNSNSDEEQLYCMPLVMCDRESMETTLRRALSSRDSRETRDTAAALWVSAGLTAAGTGLRARRLSARGRSDRDDLYVRLHGAALRSSRQPHSLELTARVLSGTGAVLSVLVSGAGVVAGDVYHTTVYYRDDRPRWHETICVRAPPDTLRGARLLLTLTHRSRSPHKTSAPLGLATLVLARPDGAAVSDGEHWLRLKKIDQRRPDGVSRALAELIAEEESGEEQPQGQERDREGVTVSTRLCSSKLTFRKEVLDVLNWTALDGSGAQLREALRGLLRAPAADVLRLLRDVLDALFDLLTRADESLAWSASVAGEEDDECLAGLVLAGVVRIGSLVQDHEHRDYQPVLDNYIDEVFYNTIAWERLLRAVERAIGTADESPRQQRRVLTLTKNLETVVRIAVRSRELQLRLAPHRPRKEFADRAGAVLGALEGLMRMGAGALLAQGACLKYLCAVGGRLAEAGAGAARVAGVLGALCPRRLCTQRAACLLEMTRGPLMAPGSDHRARLLPTLAEQLAHMIQDHTESSVGVRNVDKLARVLGTTSSRLDDTARLDDQLELCLSALCELVSRGIPTSDESDILSAALLEPLLAAVEATAGKGGEPRTQRLVAALLDVASLSGRWAGGERGACVLGALCGLGVFPRSWQVARRAAADVLADALTQLSCDLRPPAASRWMKAAATLSRTMPALAPRLALLLQNTWHSFDEETRQSAASEAIRSVLDISLIEDDDVRGIALPLLGDVVDGGGEDARDALLNEIDLQLGERGRGDEHWESVAAEHLPSDVRAPVAALLLLTRAPPALRPFAALRALATVRDHPAVYIRHVYRLARELLLRNRPAAAAHALALHAALLPASPRRLPPTLRAPASAPAALRSPLTAPRLRTALALESAALLLRAGEAESAARAVRGVAGETVGAAKQARLHLLLHTLYSAAATPSPPRALYRVRHFGKRAPALLSAPLGRVVMGQRCELLAEFCSRLLSEWPDAKLMHTLDEPTERATAADEHYVQVNAVEPAAVDEGGAVLSVTYSRPVMRPDPDEGGDEFAHMWIERTELELEESLPGVIEDSAVTGVSRTMLSPLEVALHTMRKTNDELRELLRTTMVEPLSRRLLGVADAPVQGGVAHYGRFLRPAYCERHPEDEERVQQLRRLLSAQARLLRRGVELHERLAPQELQQLHRHIANCVAARHREFAQHYERDDDDDDDEDDDCDLDVSESALCRQLEAERDAEVADADAADTPDAASRLSDVSNGTPTKRTLLTSLNQLTRYTIPSGSGNVVGTIYNTKKRDKQRARRSDVPVGGGTSQWYTNPISAHTPVSNSVSNNSLSSVMSTPEADSTPLRELWQELAPSRPPRPLSQRLSTQTTNSAPHSNRNSTGTTSEEEPPPSSPPPVPPPLPHKSAPHRQQPPTTDAPRYSYDTVLSPRGSFLYTSLQKQKHRED